MRLHRTPKFKARCVIPPGFAEVSGAATSPTAPAGILFQAYDSHQVAVFGKGAYAHLNQLDLVKFCWKHSPKTNISVISMMPAPKASTLRSFRIAWILAVSVRRTLAVHRTKEGLLTTLTPARAEEVAKGPRRSPVVPHRDRASRQAERREAMAYALLPDDQIQASATLVGLLATHTIEADAELRARYLIDGPEVGLAGPNPKE